MSIDLEKALLHKDDYAVTCCRFEEGRTIEPSMLEDPEIIPDLIDSNLLTIPENALKIGEVLGLKLKKTADALTALTETYVEGVNRENNLNREEHKEEEKEVPIDNNLGNILTNIPSVKIKIGEGKDIELEFPLFMMNQNVQKLPSNIQNEEKIQDENYVEEEKLLSRLTRKHIKIEEVVLGEETKIEGNRLTLRKGLIEEAKSIDPLIRDVTLDIVTSSDYSKYSDTIMDVQPIAVKESGEIGDGITRVIDGVCMVVTGIDERGYQISEFGSSEGEMDRNIMFNRAGSPDFGDILIKTRVVIEREKNMERPGPLAAHKATEVITKEIRDALKKASEDLIYKEETFEHKKSSGRKKVVIVKEIMGQGAMHDNLIMPYEPVGIDGAKANVDLGNVPVVVTPLQILDGCIHALTCIGPASKETSRHYFREPLVLEMLNDEELDLTAVILVGSPQINSEKFYVSKLLGNTVEAMNVDGAIVTTEGFGNNHIDFASHIEQIGKRGIEVVGMTFAGVQGQLVVGNKYMDALVDLNKSSQGIENEILENNCLTKEDAIRAIYMLKAKIAGEKIKQAERKYNSDVKLSNISLIEEATGKKIELSPNETILEKSKKRLEIYEREDDHERN
ncbi:D-proline reductase (dithiol) proprotein PrdA [Soehngenia longivitae]|uniref:D-proline reductase (Dithiol) proprotein PrdA n=1 Tax=Soehngenia longivitae TaxID=2562294 RepID=A0A4Z0D905_9FIRM|nr:D-proline reductase (dithiol) proprotein PrdA [Soehngenia longivitae]TFZ41335.1 D-proline reductase (dithiol) proprotein PrdA [Soehngenia longivitae]